jgi:hypothetical protein
VSTGAVALALAGVSLVGMGWHGARGGGVELAGGSCRVVWMSGGTAVSGSPGWAWGRHQGRSYSFAAGGGGAIMMYHESYCGVASADIVRRAGMTGALLGAVIKVPLGPLGVIAVPGVGLIWLSRARTRPGMCPCGYDLAGSPDGRCPECGVKRRAILGRPDAL